MPYTLAITNPAYALIAGSAWNWGASGSATNGTFSGPVSLVSPWHSQAAVRLTLPLHADMCYRGLHAVSRPLLERVADRSASNFTNFAFYCAALKRHCAQCIYRRLQNGHSDAQFVMLALESEMLWSNIMILSALVQAWQSIAPAASVQGFGANIWTTSPSFAPQVATINGVPCTLRTA